MFEFLGTPLAQEILGITLLVWGFVWELLAMWKAARKGQWIWFIIIFIAELLGTFSLVLAIIGSFGVLAILYFYIFSRFRFEEKGLVFEKWGNKSKKESLGKKK